MVTVLVSQLGKAELNYPNSNFTSQKGQNTPLD